MDRELIRKAAEAIRDTFQYDPPKLKPALCFDEMSIRDQRRWSDIASAALKVFLEHTRTQVREQAPVKCFDCGAAMTPVWKTSAVFSCPNCGATRQ